MTAFLAALGVVFVAELGDKSQLLVLTLAARYSPWSVLTGLALVAAALMGASVALGAGLAAALPTDAVQLVAGVAFLGFAVWTLVHGGEEPSEDAAREEATRHRSGVVSTATALGVAELGDKTMLAAMSLAATSNAVGVWIGATLGMVASSSIAIVVGHLLGRRLPERALRLASAALFALFGVLLIAGAA